MASANDMKAAKSTYGNFVTLLKWATPVAAITTLVVIFLIA